MLSGALVGFQALVPGGWGSLADDLWAGRARPLTLDDPGRPASVPVGRWRRMSRLSRLAAAVVGELLDAHPVDRASVPLLVGSAMGEVVPSSAFLDRLLAEGPRHASPLAFQGSVYNATAAQLSMAFGLRGPSETLCVGLATGLATLARGLEYLDRAERVVVVLVDDRNPTTLAAMGERRCAELVLALVLGPGQGVEVAEPGPAEVGFERHASLPYEAPPPRPAGRPIDACLGLHAAAGLATALATGAWVRDRDDGYVLAARVRPPQS